MDVADAGTDSLGSRPTSQLPRRQGADRQAQPRPSRPLVLVVEDNPHHWEIYGKILCYNGYDVSHAADGQAALNLARRQHPDLVLLDLFIPQLDGLEVCRLLRAEPQLAGMRIVVLSSRERSEWEPLARDAGCDAYLEKPISTVEVLHEVERQIGRAPLPGAGRPPLFITSEDGM